MSNSNQRGFTIIELLIATAVFSIILIVVTTAILQFSKQYYKGVISSSTQNASRTIIDDVTRAIQFSGGGITQLSSGGNTGWCIGSAKCYSYALNKQVTDSGTLETNQGRHGLVSDTVTGCNSSTPALGVTTLTSLGAPLQDAKELLGAKMRLAKFDIAGTDKAYRITVRVVYGDDDLLSNPTDPNMTCKLTAGSQFCAVSELSTTVTKRVD